MYLEENIDMRMKRIDHIYSSSNHFTLVLPDLTYMDGVEDSNIPLGMKKKISDKGSELVTNCNQLKMKSPKDGKNYKTDVADAEQLLRIIQSIPYPKAELNAVVTNMIEAVSEDKTEK